MNAQQEQTQCDVLFVFSTLIMGGSERKIVRLANDLVENGVHVSVAYLNPPITLQPMIRPEIRVENLRRKGKFSFAALRRLKRLVSSLEPKVVVAVNLYPALYVRMVGAGRSDRPWRKMCLLNTSTFVRMRDAIFRPAYLWALRGMDRVVYGSEGQRSAWVNPGDSVWSRSLVVYNGVDSAMFSKTLVSTSASELRNRLGVPEDCFCFGTVGRLVPEKNQIALIEALDCLARTGRKLHLLIVGDGPLRGDLEQTARRFGVAGMVTFLGEVEDVRPALAAMDLFVLPSTSVETFSNAALEAMAMGSPVILSGIGGATEMVTDGTEGYIVPVAQLGTRLPALIAGLYDSRPIQRAMAEAARHRVVREFSIHRMTDSYMALFSERSTRPV